MRGDRIIVQTSLLFKTAEGILPVYGPKTEPDGTLIKSTDGGVVLEKIGGVKANSLGTVAGDPIIVSANQIEHLTSEGAGFVGTKDLVPVYPIYFDEYKLIGWLPTEWFRIQGGSRI